MENHPAFLFIINESNLNQEYFCNQLSLKVLLIFDQYLVLLLKSENIHSILQLKFLQTNKKKILLPHKFLSSRMLARISSQTGQLLKYDTLASVN